MDGGSIPPTSTLEGLLEQWTWSTRLVGPPSRTPYEGRLPPWGPAPRHVLGGRRGVRFAVFKPVLSVLDGVERCERLVQLVAGDLVVLDVEGVEQGLVEQPALLVVAPAVELLWIPEQV